MSSNSRTFLLSSITMASAVLFSAPAAMAANEAQACEVKLENGSFSANISIGEFYPGSDLHKQIIRVEATPEKMALSQEMRQATIGQRDVGKINAKARMESTVSLKDKEVLRNSGWETLDLDLTLLRLTAGKWYHKNCKIETETYVLDEAQPFDGNYKSTCSLKLVDGAEEVIKKEPYLEWSFFGDKDWKPMHVRLDLEEFNAFLADVEAQAEAQREDYKSGKCELAAFGNT